MSIQGKTKNPDPTFLETLTSDTGPLACGIMPSLELGQEGEKTLCAMGASGPVTKPKPKRNEEPEATEVVPQTTTEHLALAKICLPTQALCFGTCCIVLVFRVFAQAPPVHSILPTNAQESYRHHGGRVGASD